MVEKKAQRALEDALPPLRLISLVFNPTWAEVEQLKGFGKYSFFLMEYFCRVISLPLVLLTITIVSIIPFQKSSRMLWWVLYLFGAAHFEREARIEIGATDETHEAKVV